MEEVFAILETDCLCVDDADDLPDNGQNVGVILIQERCTVNTNDFDETRAAGEELIQVLSHLVDVEVGALVHSSEVDDVINLSISIFLAALVEEVEADETIAHDIEKILIFRIDWKSIFDKFFIFALVVDASSKGTDFFIQVS